MYIEFRMPRLLRLFKEFNLFPISLKLKSDKAIYVGVKCNCNVINRPVYTESRVCVVKEAVMCSFEY